MHVRRTNYIRIISPSPSSSSRSECVLSFFLTSIYRRKKMLTNAIIKSRKNLFFLSSFAFARARVWRANVQIESTRRRRAAARAPSYRWNEWERCVRMGVRIRILDYQRSAGWRVEMRCYVRTSGQLKLFSSAARVNKWRAQRTDIDIGMNEWMNERRRGEEGEKENWPPSHCWPR